MSGKTYCITSKLSCNSHNVIYLIKCFSCREQHVDSANHFNTKKAYLKREDLALISCDF